MFGDAIAHNDERFGMADSGLKAETSLDLIWAVLEAANDLGDQTTVEVCRRVIDASLNQVNLNPASLNPASLNQTSLNRKSLNRTSLNRTGECLTPASASDQHMICSYFR